MWYGEFGHRSSSLSISEIAKFFTYLFKRKGAALSTVKGYRAMLSAVFKFPFRGSLPLLSLKTSFGLLRFLLPGLFSLLHLEIWMRFWSISRVRHLSPLAKHHFWTSPRRPCPSGYGYGQTGFGSPSPVVLCVFPGWGFGLTLLIRSSVLRRSLPPILCLVLSLFRLFRTLLPICPSGSSALSGQLSSSGKLLDQPPIFRPGFSSLLGIRDVPCRGMPFHFLFGNW